MLVSVALGGSGRNIATSEAFPDVRVDLFKVEVVSFAVGAVVAYPPARRP
jgi:hypothetical protein